MSEPTPPAGWYPDPGEPTVLRYWDGTAWTTHLQPAPQEIETVSRPDWLTNRTVAIAIVAAIVMATLGFILLGGAGESEDGEGNLSSAEAEAADLDAQAQARTAQTAIETYATDNDGLYAGASDALLAEIEPTLSTADLSVEASDESYALAAESETGAVFGVARDSKGLVTLSCEPRGAGACPESGDWSTPPAG